ncbi:MAG: hypothetical protein AUH30_14965 [Candidatus Rokubacteria bacterium 13_1_40CM_68_15]|nr:MAG: hypothetical protein AUH30_14965 [Candidatus Rokubacteria bacterium 13_1_40CM_68_15]
MALPERELQRTLRDVIIETMHAWSRDVLERPHRGFGGLPTRPFARAARLKGTIDWQVHPFDVRDPLDEDGELMTMIAAFSSDTAYETLFVIHPDRRAMSATALEAFVARLNARLAGLPALADLRVFEAHPESHFSIGGVLPRVSPFPSFQVLSHSLLKRASDSLRGSGYYDRFSPETLRALGLPRE